MCEQKVAGASPDRTPTCQSGALVEVMCLFTLPPQDEQFVRRDEGTFHNVYEVDSIKGDTEHEGSRHISRRLFLSHTPRQFLR